MRIRDKTCIAIVAMPTVVGFILCRLLREWPELAREALLCSGLALTMCGLGCLLLRAITKLKNEIATLRRDPVIKQRILELEKKASSSSDGM
ncbi:unnamed protein product [Linum trigynum]|uniref:DUF1049 domain-containing protein n=1 Tax=Linum trigynum TaxID=586398 RepID=A0AAV2D1K2_9ROSI